VTNKFKNITKIYKESLVRKILGIKMDKPEKNPNTFLFKCGPIGVPEKYKKILIEPVIGHRSDDYKNTSKNLMNGLTEILNLGENLKPFITTGYASSQFSNIDQLISEDGIVLAVDSGVFSRKAIGEQIKAGIKVHEIKVEYGKTIDLEVLANEFEKVRPEAVYITASNTSTGTYQLKPELREVIGDECLLFVDEVSLMGAYHIDRASLGIDLGFAGTQKGWLLDPGLVVGYISNRASNKIEKSTRPIPQIRNYNELVKSSADGKPFATINTSLVRALEARVYDLWQAGGADAINRRNRELNKIYEKFLEQLRYLSVESFPERKDASPTVGCYKYDPKKIGLYKVQAKLQEDKSLVEGYNGVTIDTGYKNINKLLKEKGLASGRVPLFGHNPRLVERILERQAELIRSNQSWR
tara:strand:+ start:11442 stop:12680 length:1239 start_codon:yes stop_codon:yes gene_type:complete